MSDFQKVLCVISYCLVGLVFLGYHHKHCKDAKLLDVLGIVVFWPGLWMIILGMWIHFKINTRNEKESEK